MAHEISTELAGYTLTLTNGTEYQLTRRQGDNLGGELDAPTGLEYITLTGVDGQLIRIKKTLVGVLEQHSSKVTFKADW